MKRSEEAKLLEQIEQWNDADEFSRCIAAIENIPEQDRSYALTIWLARAYSNLAVLGDYSAHGEDAEVNGELLQHAIELLESIRTQGESDPYWNARMGYAHIMADSSASTAYEYAKHWLALAPDDPDALKLVQDCEKYLQEEAAFESDWKEREELIRQETTPPADDDILGHVKKHIDQYFGTFTQILSVDGNPDLPIQIVLIPPRLEHDYYTLVTLGLSRHRMKFPEERQDEKLERAELLINLPRYWKLTESGCKEDRWSWPIQMMLSIVRFALNDPEVGLESRTTLMEGDDGIPFAENTELRGTILLWPGPFGQDAFAYRLPSGEEVNFYQVIPLYREEIQFKLENGSDALLDLCQDESLEVINPKRLNVVNDREKIGYDPAEMDNAKKQIEKIQSLRLPVDELDACNLMAFYLGWAIKRGQMSNPFLSRYRDVVEAVQSGESLDLRTFLMNKLDGKLSTQFFDRKGSGFAQWYAQDNRSNPYVYRRDCRNIVLTSLKDHHWNSVTEEEAAYLLLPYTEKNQQSVEKLLDERYAMYLETEFDNDPEERIAQAARVEPAVIPDWSGPLFCYASDRIAQDGCKVNIMYRVQPEREDMGWETGWAFYSGDEAVRGRQQ